jgi:hypothetical protein
VIAGDLGFIRLEKFWAPKLARLFAGREEAEVFEPGFPGEGFQFEFEAMREDVLACRTENALAPHELSRDVMALVEKIAESWRAQETVFA